MFDVCTMKFDKVLQYQVMGTFIVLEDITHLKTSTSLTAKCYCIECLFNPSLDLQDENMSVASLDTLFTIHVLLPCQFLVKVFVKCILLMHNLHTDQHPTSYVGSFRLSWINQREEVSKWSKTLLGKMTDEWNARKDWAIPQSKLSANNELHNCVSNVV